MLICLTTHRCLRALQRTGAGVGGAAGGGVGSGSVGGQQAAAACHKRTSVCVQRLGKEGHKQKFRQRSSCGSCGFLSAKDAGQLECADWPARASGCVLAVACFLCVILNEKSDNSSGTGCPIERQIPGVDRGPCSWPFNDLGSNKS